MPRNRRLEIPGAIYHVLTRGIERREIFKDDDDRNEFLKRLEEGLRSTGSKCYGWVLMPNHFHLLIRSSNKPLSDLMRKLLTGYAIYFNRRHKRSGYLYQNRYKSVLCSEEMYLLELVRYIHLNPLRAKLVESVKTLGNYPWSGHAVLMGTVKRAWQSTGEVLSRFGKDRNAAIKQYELFVCDAKNIGHRDDLTGGGLRRSAGGWKGVYALRRAKEYWRSDERVLGDGDFVQKVLKISEEEMAKNEKLKRDGWDIERLVKHVCALLSVSEKEIGKRSKNSNVSHARELIMYWAKTELNMTGRMLSKYFDISDPAVTKSIRRGQLIAEKSSLKLNS